jgi:hypothetical protein
MEVACAGDDVVIWEMERSTRECRRDDSILEGQHNFFRCGRSVVMVVLKHDGLAFSMVEQRD